MPRICITPRVEGAGGMASFRLKFEAGLRARGVDVTYNLNDSFDAALVIAGTRNLLPLWKAKRRGLRLVQRLDGINWVQRARWTGARYHLRAEYGNALLAFIRSRFAARVIYQSQFIRDWWEGWYGAARAPARVIHNGVDLNTYSPAPGIAPHPPYRLLVVEGSLAGGLDTGLRAAVRLAELLNEKFPLELSIAGRMDAAKQNGRDQPALPELDHRSAGLRITGRRFRYRLFSRTGCRRRGPLCTVWRRSVEARSAGCACAGKSRAGGIERSAAFS